MTSATAPPRAHLPDWDYDGRGGGPGGRGRMLAMGGVVTAAAVVGAIAAWLVLGPIGIVAFAALFAGAIVWTASNSGRGMLRREKAVRVKPGDSPRLQNVVEGLAETTRLPVPEVWLIEDPAPNALVCFTRRPAIAVTSGLVDGYTRTELEAVVAHCYVRLAATSTPVARTMLALSYVSPAFGVPVGDVDDVRAAAITRYPPALARAVEKAAPRRGRGAAFWFVADDAMHVPRAERSKALLDL